jgi:hypothetical protein
VSHLVQADGYCPGCQGYPPRSAVVPNWPMYNGMFSHCFEHRYTGTTRPTEAAPTAVKGVSVSLEYWASRTTLATGWPPRSRRDKRALIALLVLVALFGLTAIMGLVNAMS